MNDYTHIQRLLGNVADVLLCRYFEQAGGTSDADDTATSTIGSAGAVQLPHVRMRPLRMSDITTAQRRVVPTFWQAEAYRTTYDSYMCSLMEHAKKNWSQ